MSESPGLKRFLVLGQRALSLDGFAAEDPELGLAALRSHLESRCVALARAVGAQGVQNGGIDGASVAASVPGGMRELRAGYERRRRRR
jgi:propanediol dehydratase large subunit